MAKLLLDTGVVLRHLRGHQPTVALLRSVGRSGRLAIATVTRVEVHAGMHPHERYVTQKLLSRYVAFDLDRVVADLAGGLVEYGRRSQQAIDVPDAIIAATALVQRLTLVTYNTNHFVNISGLSLYPIERLDK